VATVPAGTVFYQGRLPRELLESKPVPPPSFLYRSLASEEVGRVDYSIDRAGPPVVPFDAGMLAVPPPEAPPNDIFVSERYRRARIAQLLRHAADMP
jgi:hypothetical protein